MNSHFLFCYYLLFSQRLWFDDGFLYPNDSVLKSLIPYLLNFLSLCLKYRWVEWGVTTPTPSQNRTWSFTPSGSQYFISARKLAEVSKYLESEHVCLWVLVLSPDWDRNTATPSLHIRYVASWLLWVTPTSTLHDVRPYTRRICSYALRRGQSGSPLFQWNRNSKSKCSQTPPCSTHLTITKSGLLPTCSATQSATGKTNVSGLNRFNDGYHQFTPPEFSYLRIDHTVTGTITRFDTARVVNTYAGGNYTH